MEAREYSSGGVVHRDGSVLLVQVKNLQGRVVWTFPKGHLEKGETALRAALREVEEETGWRCKSTGVLMTARYRFERKGRPVDKRVRWYRMEPLELVGEPDAEEILRARWTTTREAARRLAYPSDKVLLKTFIEGLP